MSQPNRVLVFAQAFNVLLLEDFCVRCHEMENKGFHAVPLDKSILYIKSEKNESVEKFSIEKYQDGSIDTSWSVTKIDRPMLQYQS